MANRKNNPDRPVERTATDLGDLNPRSEPDQEELGTSAAGTAGIAGLNAPYGSNTPQATDDVIGTAGHGGSGGPGPGDATVQGSVNNQPDPGTPPPGDLAVPGAAGVDRGGRSAGRNADMSARRTRDSGGRDA